MMEGLACIRQHGSAVYVGMERVFDAGECQPKLLSMEWYPSLFLKVFPPVGFSMQAYVFFRNTWHHPYISTCFCGKRFYFPHSRNNFKSLMELMAGLSFHIFCQSYLQCSLKWWPFSQVLVDSPSPVSLLEQVVTSSM